MNKKYFLAILSGLLLAFSFPTAFGGVKLPNLGFLAWISMVPLFYLLRTETRRNSFIYSFVTAVVAYGVSFYWIYIALTQYGGLGVPTSITLLVLMVVYLGAYFALAPFLARVLNLMGSPIPLILLMPVCWVAVAFLRSYLPFGGFPWNEMHSTQYRYLHVIQNADVTGIYGLTFVIIMVNQYLAELVAFIVNREHRGLLIKKTVAIVLLVALMFVYGHFRMKAVAEAMEFWPTKRIAVVQGNVAQSVKWQEGEEAAQLAPYLKAMQSLQKMGLHLIVWPEASYPYSVPMSDRRIPLEQLGLKGGAAPNEAPWLLLGALSQVQDQGSEYYFNSSILLDQNGEIRDRYHKSHLVPFGEYIPMRKFLFFAKKLTAPVGDFRAPSEIKPIQMGSLTIGPLICYEDIFPQISWKLARGGAKVLINQTNDAWYDTSSAAYQHLAAAVFRSVENRRTLVRAANTGASAVVDPLGRIVIETALFQPGVVTATVRMSDMQTVYMNEGDWFGAACVAVAGLGLLRLITRRGCCKRKN